MPTIIDHLIIELELDPKAFTEGQKKGAEAFLKLKDTAEETGKAVEGPLNKMSEGFAALGKRVIAFAAAIAGVTGLTQFGEKIVSTNIDLRNLSIITGESVEKLSMFGAVIEQMGGSAHGALSAVQAISKEVTNFATGKGAVNLLSVTSALNKEAGAQGKEEFDPFSGPNTLKKPTELIDGIIKLMDKLNTPHDVRVGFLRQLGIDDTTSATLLKIGTGMKGMLDAQENIYKVTNKNIEAAENLAKSWHTLSQAAQQFGQIITTWLAEPLARAFDKLSKIMGSVNAGAEHAYKVFGPDGAQQGGSGGGGRGDQPQNNTGGADPASMRYNNPGAQYPNVRDAQVYGGEGYGVIGGGHLIQKFKTPEEGAASNMDLFSRKYTGMPLGAAGAKWTGNNSFGVPGFDPNTVITPEMARDPKVMIPLMKAIARRETGRDYPMNDDQWKKAFEIYQERKGQRGRLDGARSGTGQGSGAAPDKATDPWNIEHGAISYLSNPRLLRAPRFNQAMSLTNHNATSEVSVHSLIVNGNGKGAPTDDAYGISNDAVPALSRYSGINQVNEGPR